MAGRRTDCGRTADGRQRMDGGRRTDSRNINDSDVINTYIYMRICIHVTETHLELLATTSTTAHRPSTSSAQQGTTAQQHTAKTARSKDSTQQRQHAAKTARNKDSTQQRQQSGQGGAGGVQVSHAMRDVLRLHVRRKGLTYHNTHNT